MKTTAYYSIRRTFAGVFCTPIRKPCVTFVGKGLDAKRGGHIGYVFVQDFARNGEAYRIFCFRKYD